MNWLDVLPCATYENLVLQEAPSPLLKPDSGNMVMYNLRNVFYRDLERTIGYEFRRKEYLLQALTHPSYSKHGLTDCYQKLEFLGDSVVGKLTKIVI